MVKVDSTLLLILVISVAGPIVGSFIGIIKKPSEKFMYNMLAFAGGVMLAISFLELIPESIKFSSMIICSLGILFGSFIMFILEKTVPHEHASICPRNKDYELKRTSLYLIFGMFLHNFPEGMAIATGTVSSDLKTSLIIALAIAIHNIPEGICTSVPYYLYSKKRLKSFLVSSVTAIPVLIGFVSATFIFQNISNSLIGFIIGATAGLMIYITADELIPSSCCKLTNNKTIFYLVAGILLVVLLGAI